MDSLERLYIDNINTIYGIDNNLVIIPNNLNGNIGVYLVINNIVSDKNYLMTKIQECKKSINASNSNSILFLYSVNGNNFENNLNDIKFFVNKVYNVMLSTKRFSKENFIKKIKVIKDDGNVELIKWLCMNYSNKFSIVDINGIVDVNDNVNDNFTSSYKSLAIGNTPINNSNQSINIQSFENKNSGGFIKWYSIVLILFVSLVIGISVSLYLLK